MPCCGCCCAKVGGECCGPEDDRNCCKPDEGICCGPDGETQVCCPPERDCCSVYTIGEGEAEVCCAESQYCCFGEANPTAGICCEDTEVCCPGDVASSCCSPNQYCCDGVCQDEPCEGACETDEDCCECWYSFGEGLEITYASSGPCPDPSAINGGCPETYDSDGDTGAFVDNGYCCAGECQREPCQACQETAGTNQPAGTDCATVDGYTVYGGVDPDTGEVWCLQTGCRPSSSIFTACCPDNCVTDDPDSICFQDDPP